MSNQVINFTRGVPAIESFPVEDLIEETADGCTMHRRFHLGWFQSTIPVLEPLLTTLVDRPVMRRRLVNDRIGVALLHHCFEEMHHLAAILPQLHQHWRPYRPKSPRGPDAR